MKTDLFQAAYYKFDFTDKNRAEQLVFDLIDIGDVMGYKNITVVQAVNLWIWFSGQVFEEIWHVPMEERYMETIEMSIVYFVRQFGTGSTTEQTRSIESYTFN